jgi:hypothetical protein
MKRALVLSLVVVLGLGVGAFAQLTGAWESTLSFNLGATSFDKYIVGLTSTFEIDYTLAGWTFGSVSGFDLTGFASQAFSVEGALGAFTFESSAAFAPMAVSLYNYPHFAGNLQSASVVCGPWWVGTPDPTTSLPKFLTLDATASVSIAGVTASAYVYMDQSNMVVTKHNYAFNMLGAQTDSVIMPGYSNGTGAKITIAGSIGGMDVTSYTYFNLWEDDVLSTYCPQIGKLGTFSIAAPGCGVAFTEEYVMFEGMTFGCVEFSAALQIYCDGFSSLKVIANGIDIGGWATFNVGIIFGTASKDVDLCLTLNSLTFTCVTVEVGLGLGNGTITGSDNATLSVSDISIHGFGFTTEVGAVTFTAATELDAYSKQFSTATAWKYLNGDVMKSYLIPWAGISSFVPGVAAPVCFPAAPTYDAYQYVQVVNGYWELLCVPEYRYKLWEMFTISIDEDACCGGLFGVDIKTYFGDKETLQYVGYAVFPAGGTSWVLTYLLAALGYTAPPAPTAACFDLVVPFKGYVATGATQLFNWAYTTVEFSVGMGSNLTLNLGAGISAFGWEDLSLGFEFTW